MNINWILRLKNKTTLVAIISAIVVFVYSVASAFGFQLPVTQEQIMAGVSAVLTVLVALGVIVDPTTKGISDSEQALSYASPKTDSSK